MKRICNPPGRAAITYIGNDDDDAMAHNTSLSLKAGKNCQGYHDKILLGVMGSKISGKRISDSFILAHSLRNMCSSRSCSNRRSESGVLSTKGINTNGFHHIKQFVKSLLIIRLPFPPPLVQNPPDYSVSRRCKVRADNASFDR